MARQNWSDEDIAKLIELRDAGKSKEYIAEYMGRTFNSIQSKLNKIHIQEHGKDGPKNARTRWTNELNEELIKLINQNKTEDELAEHFHRTKQAIIIHVNRMGLQVLKLNRAWTTEDDKNFALDWADGSISLKSLYKKYNRNYFGLRKRAQVLNLGPRPYNDIYIPRYKYNM